MKTNPNDPVDPITEWVADEKSSTGFSCVTSPSLTKREYFAALAMQSMANNDGPLIEIANAAVLFADELIMALNRTANQEV